jgi:RNA polymerase sigma-70 factor (ECF subfamily)
LTEPQGAHVIASLSDKELADRTAQGDQSAFLALYDRYSGRVYALAVRIMGDPMLAEEVTQDAFIKLWDRARQYLAERGLLLPWLLTITRYTALDRLRLEGRRPALSTAEDPELLWQKLPDPTSQPDEARWRSLYLIVQALPVDQRKVIDLAYYQGLSQSEIAETLGWPLGTVKTRLRAAMESLRDTWLNEV